MKRVLCSLALATVLLVGTSGAWAFTIIDTFNSPVQSQIYDPPDATGAAGNSTGNVGTSCTDIIGCTRQMQVRQDTTGLNVRPVTADVDSLDNNELAFATPGSSDGRVLLRWDSSLLFETPFTGATPPSLGGIDIYTSAVAGGFNVFRFVITNLDVYLLAGLTICGDTDAGAGVLVKCFKDLYEKPAFPDPPPSPGAPPITAPPADNADHFLDSNPVTGSTNFVQRAAVGILGIDNHNTDFFPVLGTAVDDEVRNALHAVTAIQIVIRVQDAAHTQTPNTGIDLSLDCVEIVADGGPVGGKAVSLEGSQCHVPTAIPEPATLTLMGLGLVGLGLGAVLRRRGRKA